MKAVARSLSVLALCILLSQFASAQKSIITQKKFILPVASDIIAIDTSLSYKLVKLPKIYDYDQLAIFCKIEENVARKSKVNMRFRLGSLDYVNYLEKKPNWQLSKTNIE